MTTLRMCSFLKMIVGPLLLAAAFPGLANAAGDYAEELELTDSNLAEKPNAASLWYFRSTLSLRNHEPEQAAKDAEKAELLAPGAFPTRAVVAQALAETGQLRKALELLDSEIARIPNQAEARLVRARLHASASRIDLALTDYRIAIRNLPSPTPPNYLEVVTILLDNGYRPEAVDLLNLAIARLGKDPQLLAKALELALASKNFDAALVLIADLEWTSPSRPEPWMAERAKVLALAGRGDESRAVWTALRDRIAALPNLEKGKADLAHLTSEAERYLTDSGRTNF